MTQISHYSWDTLCDIRFYDEGLHFTDRWRELHPAVRILSFYATDHCKYAAYLVAAGEINPDDVPTDKDYAELSAFFPMMHWFDHERC